MTNETIKNIGIFLLILLILVLIGLIVHIVFFKQSSIPKPPGPKPPGPKPETRVQWYPDKNGKFSPSVKAKDVENFQINLGAISSPSPWKFTGKISNNVLCDKDPDRLLYADYLARVYNGTSRNDLLRLDINQLKSIISSMDWIYITPNMPKDINTFFNDKKRFISITEHDNFCKNNKTDKTCVKENYSDLETKYWLATNSSWMQKAGQSPINAITSNWTGDRNQAYLFQTMMRKGDGSFGKDGPNSKRAWWGNNIFADPTRSSLRRGMMNSPQNNPDFYDVAFGYGGVPCDVLFEGGIMPIDSAFAQPGTIQGPLKVPNICNPTDNKKCVLNPNAKKSSAVYTYLLPGSGMFFESGQCGYMYNFVDGLLNIPPECYCDNENIPGPCSTWDGSLYSDVLTRRSPNGLPDHVIGVSKLLIYLARKVFFNKNTIAKATARSKLPSSDPNAFNAAEQKKWDQFQQSNNKFTEMNVRLPVDLDKYLSNPIVEPRFKKAGLGLQGLADPVDTQAPPRAYVGPRALHGQVAALMGVYQQPDINNRDKMSDGEYYGLGLFTQNGQTKKADCLFVDKRRYAMGWINGRWYGYPPESKYNYSQGLKFMNKTYPNISDCESKIGAKYTPASKVEYVNGGIFTKGGKNGVPGKQELSTEKWSDGYFMPTEDNPLIYYGIKDPKTGKKEEIYRTWYGKPIEMDYISACKLIGLFYSQGDTGWDETPVSWPFGSYFAYAEDLGIGKYAIGGQLQTVFGAQSLHYTMTSTSLAQGQLVSPAYDYEIVLTLPDKQVSTINCFCEKYMKSVNLLYNDGKYLQDYTQSAKGALGGWFPKEAGVPYDGSKGLSNFTTLMTGPEYAKDPTGNKQKGILPINPNCVKTDAASQCLFANFDPTQKNQVTNMSNVLVPTNSQNCK